MRVFLKYIYPPYKIEEFSNWLLIFRPLTEYFNRFVRWFSLILMELPFTYDVFHYSSVMDVSGIHRESWKVWQIFHRFRVDTVYPHLLLLSLSLRFLLMLKNMIYINYLWFFVTYSVTFSPLDDSQILLKRSDIDSKSTATRNSTQRRIIHNAGTLA